MEHRFEMVAKTFKGLEEILAEELRQLGAVNVEPGRRMVSFEGDLAMLYRANICCRTALSILKPIYKFIAKDTDSLYEMVKEYNWSDVMSIEKTFSIDTTSHSSEFTHSRFVTYRVKDAIVDYFKDRFGQDKRPGVRLNDADVMINVHIDGDRVTLSLNSSGESLHKRGWRVAQTEAPINEVLAAGIILKSGWRGDSPLVDPMCGSGTFLIEAAMIAAGIKPGSFRKDFAFEHWRDYDAELFEKVMAEDSGLREVPFKIYGSDISPKAVAIAERNILSAGVDEYINLRIKPLQLWEEAPAGGAPGVLITNPPYGERINVQDMEQLYKTLGTKFKRVFLGYHAWVISSNIDYLTAIGLTPSVKEAMQNGGLDCELREYVIFEGTKSDFRREGGVLKEETPDRKERRQPARKSDSEWRRDAREKGMGGKDAGAARRKPNKLEDRYRPQKGGYARSEERRRKFKEETAAQSEAEQLLSRHRNPHALKSLGESPKRPSIPAPDGPFMRTRRRWKRPDADNSSSEGEA
ncbi:MULTISPECIES: class I SAM-dependent RNA methyltransferase [Duncaniella]|jgi:putative N6-adenine-specific DNA methylase|uniref:RNA methyltransferase n=4 Tax=Duncaniella muris TaxID=2094150 RepID=A0A2V1IQY4_9BACT|nr:MULTISPECIES: THUMP domain-containing protein [Duncaniella]NBH91441.1 RNA methyltransferase [Muribaculaceae bacterium S4]NBI19763.1 RNA methyltransferase [Muribaculaceae bacterium Z1]PWB02455.1 RNA methyltransferase [Duncaniella muris]QCD38252.1 RNA methyltransferase [Duncaniella sp. C9]QCP71940.1 RNA methyltransferase [Duncaniella sp. B8]